MTISRTTGAITALVALIAVVVIAASLWILRADSTYFGSFDSSTAVTGPASPGERVYVGIWPIDVRPGDRVKLVAVDAGPAVTRALAAALKRTTGSASILVINERDLAPGELDWYQTLPTGEWSAEDGTIGLVVEVVMPPTVVTITRPELTFIVNGGLPQHVHFPMAARLCLRPASGPFECESPEAPH